VISSYESMITNNITVPVEFGEMSSGLGESEWYYGSVSYQTYCNDLRSTIGSTSVGATIFGAGGSIGATCGTDNPVTGTSSIDVKVNNAAAVGIGMSGGTSEILANTSITDAGGCTSDDGDCYALVPVIEHELDEVLTISGGNTPLPEDLFRFSGAGTRSFVNGVSCTGTLGSAYFSINDGATNLAGFNNACNGGDWGDWDSGADRVQNAFADPLPSDPSLGVEETALEAIGYTFESPTPEPATILLIGSVLGLMVFFRRRSTIPR
jgi:hypothetical protein